MRYSSKAKKVLDKIRRKCILQTGAPDMYYRNDERFRILILDRCEQGEIRGRIYLLTGNSQKRISNFVISQNGDITNGPNHLKGLIHA